MRKKPLRGPQLAWRDTRDEAAICLNCELADCDQKNPRCPFFAKAAAKRRYDRERLQRLKVISR